jgi:hypothetical protein
VERQQGHDPTLAQAVGYASWYLSRAASPSEIDARLAASRDHQWLTAADRAEVIAEAQRQYALLQRLWEALPQLRIVFTPASQIKRRHRKGGGNRGPR